MIVCTQGNLLRGNRKERLLKEDAGRDRKSSLFLSACGQQNSRRLLRACVLSDHGEIYLAEISSTMKTLDLVYFCLESMKLIKFNGTRTGTKVTCKI